MRKLIITIAMTACAGSHLFADLNDDLNTFFSKYNSSATISGADIYQGQKAGYVTGGGLTIRNRVMNSDLIAIDWPRFDAGCGGIDIYTGGFSFINRQQLIDSLKSVGSSSMGYAFLLALETVSPQITSVMKTLQDWQSRVNQHGINSCELASSLVDAVRPKAALVGQQVCRFASGKQGAVSDWIAGREWCSQESGHQQVMDKMRDSEATRDILVEDFNIAWQAIQKQSFLAANRNMAEIFMSLTGTLISKREDTTSIVRKPSKIDNESFLSSLIHGGPISIYRCEKDGGDKCLVIADRSLNIDPSSAWVHRIRETLLRMQQCIQEDQEIPLSDREILAKSKLPLYKIVNLMTAYKQGYCPLDFYRIAEIVAMDLLVQYLNEVVSLVRDGARQLKMAQMYSQDIDEYLADLARIEQKVRHYETRASRQMQEELLLIQKVQMIEKQIASELVLY